jgi:hypothetical protein
MAGEMHEGIARLILRLVLGLKIWRSRASGRAAVSGFMLRDGGLIYSRFLASWASSNGKETAPWPPSGTRDLRFGPVQSVERMSCYAPWLRRTIHI